MPENTIYELFSELRGKVHPNEMMSKFIINYYLSRKLKHMNFNQVVEQFNDDTIESFLREVFEDKNNSLNEFKVVDDIPKKDLIDIISKASESLGRYGGEFTTPISIIELGLSILNLNSDDVFLDYGSGIGSTLLTASQYTDKLYGVEINKQSYAISRILLDLFNISSNNVMNNDVHKANLKTIKANKMFVNMPFALRLPREKHKEIINIKFNNDLFSNILHPRDTSWVYPLDLIENTDFERFVMLIHGSPLYSVQNFDVREYLIKSGYIESVVALPSNLFSSTSIPVYMIVFSKNNDKIKFVDATREYTEVKFRNILESKHIDKIVDSLSKESIISKTKTIEELEKEEFTLEPLRYVIKEFPFDEYITLEEVILSINRGSTMSKEELQNITSDIPTNCQYLMLNDFQDGILNEELTYLKDLDDSHERFLIKDNSIIVSRISPFKIGTVDKLKTKILANGNLFFLEINEHKINKDFLTAYLQSRIGLRELDKYAKGTVMKTISIRDLEKIKVPRMSRSVQDKIAKEFNLLNSEFKAIKKRNSEIQKERLNIFEGGI